MKRSSVVPVLVVLLYLTACVSIIGGPWGVSPSQFDFQPMVPLREPGPGGWKSAQAVIFLIHVTPSGIRTKVRCQVQVEVPELNYLGIVTNEFAQLEAARAADIAAERALKHGGLSAEMCIRFMKEMEGLLQKEIPGARVLKF